jgi:citrate lyase beta subunit
LTTRPERRQLKAAGRVALTDLARSHANLFAGQPIGVRINRISGPEAALDIYALAQASRTVTFDCIVTTKVETAAEIATTLARLREASVAFRTVIPIVETRRGIAALGEIAAAARDAGLSSLCYGHFDYALDAGWWPIPDPREPELLGRRGAPDPADRIGRARLCPPALLRDPRQSRTGPNSRPPDERLRT